MSVLQHNRARVRHSLLASGGLTLLLGAVAPAGGSEEPLWWPLAEDTGAYRVHCTNRLRRSLDEVWFEAGPESVFEAREAVVARGGHVDHRQAAASRLQLAQVLYLAGDAPAAIEQARMADVLVSDSEGQSSPQRIVPLTMIGRAAGAAGRYAEAIDALETANELYRRQHGLHAPCQSVWLMAQAEVEQRAGQLEDADRRQLEAFAARSRRAPVDTDLTLDALVDLAEWQWWLHAELPLDERARMACLISSDFAFGADKPRRCRNPGVRELYIRAVRILETEHGADSPSLVAPLRGLALTYFFGTTHRYGAAPGESRAYSTRLGFHGPYQRARELLERAREIAADLPEPQRGQQLTDLLVDLGDWHMIYDAQPDTALDYYGRAHALTGAAEDAGLQPARFVEPVRLVYLPPAFQLGRSRGLVRSAGPMLEGWIKVEFTVTADGRARDARVIETDPPGWRRYHQETLRSLATSRFRPAWDATGPVATRSQVLYRFEYAAPPQGTTAAGGDPASERG